jgi:hypothetical protein
MSSDPNKAVKVVFTCLDWRLHPAIEEYFTKDGTGCDMCVTAGSVKSLINPTTQTYLLEQIEISKKLHNCRAIILTIHIDCGAYGGSKAFANMDAETAACSEQLNRAKKILNENFPDLPVESYIIGLEHTEIGWQILPRQINL